LNRSKIEGAALLNKKFYCLVTDEGAVEQAMERLKANENGEQQKPWVVWRGLCPTSGVGNHLSISITYFL
jgi:hypothetical protein